MTALHYWPTRTDGTHIVAVGEDRTVRQVGVLWQQPAKQWPLGQPVPRDQAPVKHPSSNGAPR